MIPKTIHQIWIGPKPAPKGVMDTWRRNHPEWDYRLWTEQTIDFPLRNQAQYEAMGNLGGKADILRYEILQRYGGVYLDADLTCLRPLDQSFLNNEFFAAYESEQWRPGLIANGILGAVPGHPIMEQMIGRICTLDPDDLRKSCPAIDTGPYALTEILETFEGQVKIYPSHFFYPEHIQDVFTSSEYFFARHDWFSDYPTLGLAMVVAGETSDLWRSLPRLKRHITYWAIAVTDQCGPESRQAIETILGGLPGVILEVGAANLGPAWSQVLENLRGKADFALLSEPNLVLYDFCRYMLKDDSDSFRIMEHSGASRSSTVSLIRPDGGWQFSGTGLQSLCREIPAQGGSLLDRCHMLRFESRPTIVPRLQKEESILFDDLDRKPEDPETLFYLGQYFEDTGDPGTAVDFYRRRVEAGGWADQALEACWRIARCLKSTDSPWASIEKALLRAHQMDPTRPEPLLELGLEYLNQTEHDRATDFLMRAASVPPRDRPFGQDPMVRQKALESLNISAFYARRYTEGLRAGLEALRSERTILPKEQIITNIGFYPDKMRSRSQGD